MSKQSVEISLLGRFQVRVSETRLGSDDIPGRKAPALLKLLALNSDHQARVALASRQIKALERAAVLYTGDLLPMDLYATWAQAPRDHLRQFYVDVLLALAQEYQSRGDLAAAAETYRTALDKDVPLQLAHRGLMAIFAQQGQRDRALKQYGVCLDVLADELGVAPSRETRALYDRIDQELPGGEASAERP